MSVSSGLLAIGNVIAESTSASVSAGSYASGAGWRSREPRFVGRGWAISSWPLPLPTSGSSNVIESFIVSLDEYVFSNVVVSDAEIFNVVNSSINCNLVSDCKGKYIDDQFLSGTATSGSTGSVLVDSSAEFDKVKVERGDILTDSSGNIGIVYSRSATQLTGVNITEWKLMF